MPTAQSYLMQLLDLQSQNPNEKLISPEEADTILSGIARNKLTENLQKYNDPNYLENEKKIVYRTPMEDTQVNNIVKESAKKETTNTDVPWWIEDGPRIAGGIIAGVPTAGNPAAIGAGSAVGELVSDVIQNVGYGQHKNLLVDPLKAGAIDATAAVVAPPVLKYGGALLSKIPVVGPAVKYAGDKIAETVGNISGALQKNALKKGTTELEKHASQVLENTPVDEELAGQVDEGLQTAYKQAKTLAGQMYDDIQRRTIDPVAGQGKTIAANHYIDAIQGVDQEIIKDRSGSLGAQIKPVLSRLKNDLDEFGEAFTFEELRSTRQGLNAAIKQSLDTNGSPTPLTTALEKIKAGVEKDLEKVAEASGKGVYEDYKIANQFYRQEVVPKKGKLSAQIKKTAENAPENLSKKFAKSPTQVKQLENISTVKDLSGKPIKGTAQASVVLEPMKQQMKRDLFEGIKKTNSETGAYELNPVGFLDKLRKPQFKKAFVEFFGPEEFSKLEKYGVEAVKSQVAFKQAQGDLAKQNAQVLGREAMQKLNTWFGFGVGELYQSGANNQ